MTDKSMSNQPIQDVTAGQTDLNSIDGLQHYLKSTAGSRQGRSIPPLADWHPTQVADMDLVIKANGEWWHEGSKMTRESLVSLFATILWQEEKDGITEYFLKTPVQLLRIQVEDVPLLINDVGIVLENDISWLEFTTTTGDVVRLDEAHQITLLAYHPHREHSDAQIKRTESEVRPYMPVRKGLMALIGRNAFYHLTEIGELSERNGATILTLYSGGQAYTVAMPID
ncbi:DUF1285 domain-containing protein [Psychrobacter sp. GP33]|uniref:DUF1285 domain-containing protein n=1 Tax=Psychrobacter sp. GP33 TaxID=2758709 RepID=UPI0015FC98E0|nr:DUF1285 domain-containing protein [Psychrobacter sp. GP33]